MSKISVLSPGVAQDTALPHVLLVVDQFPRALGGGERILLKLAALLPAYGFRTSILTFAAHPESAALQSPPCPVYLLPLTRTYDFNALRSAFELRRFLRRERVEIVQTFFESSDLWAGFVAKMTSSAKLVWSRRDMGILRGRKHSIAYRRMAGLPDAVFAVSEQVRRHCIEVDGIAQERVQTVYNGLNIDDWDGDGTNGKESGRTIVTTAGNIRRVKGHDIFIRAAASLAAEYPQAFFSIAGDVLEQEYFEELQALVKELNLSGRFEFLGGVAKLREHLATADVFVLPSRSEGFSNAIVEAMATGLPVVATDVGGNAEAVEDGVSGFVVPPEDVNALACATAKLLADARKAAAMGAKGKALVAEKFTTEAMMRSISSCYRRLLGTAV